MILFLDTIAPLSEFSLIEDNKIIFSKKILENKEKKMSDCIIPTYIEIKEKFQLDIKLKLLIVTTGPGSFTALRIGIAFFVGLGISMKIPVIGVTALKLYNFYINKKKDDKILFHIHSSNNQDFISYLKNDPNEYLIEKVENKQAILNLDNKINNFLTNDKIALKAMLEDDKFIIKEIDYKKVLTNNIKAIMLLPRPKIIEPIYISNNRILN